MDKIPDLALDNIVLSLDRRTILALVCTNKKLKKFFERAGDNLFGYLIKRDCHLITLLDNDFSLLDSYRRIYKRNFVNFLSVYQQKYTNYKEVVEFNLNNSLKILLDNGKIIDDKIIRTNTENHKDKDKDVVKIIKSELFIYKLKTNGSVYITLINKRIKVRNIIRGIKDYELFHPSLGIDINEMNFFIDIRIYNNLLSLLDNAGREYRYSTDINVKTGKIVMNLDRIHPKDSRWSFMNYFVSQEGIIVIDDIIILPDKYLTKNGKTFHYSKANKFVFALVHPNQENGIYGVLNNGKLIYFKNPYSEGIEMPLPSGTKVMPTIEL